MREREQASDIAAARGYGRYEGFACPEKSPNGASWVLCLPLAAGAVIVAKDLLHGLDEGYRWLRIPAAVLSLALAAYFVVFVFSPLYFRRPGGPAPRLYCFEDGVVVAIDRVLRPFGWEEISIERESWWNSDWGWGMRRAVKGPDGSVLLQFTGREGPGCGDWLIEELHHAAVRRGAADGATDHRDHSSD
ncbi:hypothetical protein ABZT06_42610 [Streptomyces sp. NPDC005483]|uniref:hypothetical protein n=1 Tax=Streptomyces sp. NPDC005483 TaxID=3154882 RepID=UPI0033A79417